MKKNLQKKLVLKKHTVTSLNAEQLKALQGGNIWATFRLTRWLLKSEPLGESSDMDCQNTSAYTV